MTNHGRRHFLTGFLLDQVAKAAASFQRGVAEAREAQELEDFFASHESSYALTLAYPDEILHASARRAGIPFEGREKEAVVRDLIRLARRP